MAGPWAQGHALPKGVGKGGSLRVTFSPSNPAHLGQRLPAPPGPGSHVWDGWLLPSPESPHHQKQDHQHLHPRQHDHTSTAGATSPQLRTPATPTLEAGLYESQTSSVQLRQAHHLK